jgi:hypothetical protein
MFIRWLSLHTAVIFGSLLIGFNVFGQQSVTIKGVTYVDAELIKEYPQSVYISHAAGKGFVNKADLSADDAQALGVAQIQKAPTPSRTSARSSASASASRNKQLLAQMASW